MKWVWVAILLSALATRFWQIDRRPMHADEAVLADKFGTLLGGGGYPYDPREFHGPALAWATLPAAWGARQTSYAALTETTLRAVPAIAGALAALVPLLLAPVIGRMAAITAAAIVALHPGMVFYSQYYIPEMLLVLWSGLFLAAIARGAPAWVLGACFALMLATKETAVVVGAAAAIAYLVTRRRLPSWRSAVEFTAPVALVLAAAGRSTLEAVRVWGERGLSGGGHAHPWHYYLPLAGLLLVFAAGAWRERFFAVFAIALTAIYSAIPYKTPWCVAGILFALAICAGVTVARWRWSGVVLAAALLLAMRTEWSYVPTLPAVFSVREAVDRLAADTLIDVYTRQNLWPLPWYLRKHRRVRWYVQGVPKEAGAAAVVLMTPEVEEEVSRRLYEAPPPGQRELYVPLFEPLELRRGVRVSGYVARSLAESR
jgi:predicted membrane-bound mannosyltransferase